MEQQSWRTELAQDFRNRLVSRIMDTLQRHTPLEGQDGVKELRKIACRFEEEIFISASDQHDYLRKISSKMLNLETQTQNATSSPLATDLSGTTQGPVRQSMDAGDLGDSLQQVSQAGEIDEADKVWTKMQMLKEQYLQDMKDLYSILTTRSQQDMPQEQLQKLMHYREVLRSMMPYLIAPKGGLPTEFTQDRAEAFEQQIASIIDTFKRHKRPKQRQGNPGPASGGQQPPQQAAQISRPNNKQRQPLRQQTLQGNPTPTESQASNASDSSFPSLQSDASSLEQSMGLASQPTPLYSLANTTTNALHQGTMASYGQNTTNPLQMNLLVATQPQQHVDKQCKCISKRLIWAVVWVVCVSLKLLGYRRKARMSTLL